MSFPLASIDTDALRNNLDIVRKLAPRSRVLAIVKSNGYGHGMERVARALPDVDGFGVARLDEGQELRAGGISQRIVLLEGVFSPESLAAAAQQQLDIVVHSFEQLAMLEQFDGSHRFAVWLKVNTGMNRLGFRLQDFAAVNSRLRSCAAVGELLLMSHFASAEEPSGAAARMQLRAFNDVAKSLRLERSMANSAGIIDWPDAHFEWVRPGIALYGISPLENKSAASLGLRPAMTLTTRLIAIQDVQAGEAVGYYGVWRAPRRSRIGVAAIGYGDGYPRGMRGGAPVLVTGREAPVVGRVSMDMMTVDITDLPDAKVGDTVTLWGEGLPSERVAAYADTLGYELVCRVTERVAMRWK